MYDTPADTTVNNSEESYETKALEIEAEETEVLKSLLAKQNKQLFYSRIASLAVIVMAAAVVIVCIVIVPRVLTTLNQVNTLLSETETTVEQLEDTLTQANGMIGEITTAATGINSLVDDNEEILKESVEKMNSIDFEGLNTAIGDLQAVVEPLAKLFGKR